MSQYSRAIKTPTFESGRLTDLSGKDAAPYRPGQTSSTTSNTSNMSTRSNYSVVKEHTDHKSGNKVQLVRTIPEESESTDEIVNKLFKNYTYSNGGVRANKDDLDQFNKAFPTHGKKIIDNYDGSNIMSDNNQSLIGEEYYAKQIADIKEKNKTSFLTKWDHLLYQGDETYIPSIATPLPHINFTTAPTMSKTYSLSSTKQDGSKTYSTSQKKTARK